jgi:hypothetical protein
MTFRSGDIVLVPFPFTDRPLLATVQDGVCRNFGCTAYSVMEPGTPYREKP